MSTSIGTISLDMILNSAKFKKQLDNVQNQANLASQKIADSLKKIGTTITTAFSVAAITAFGKSCIELGSELAEVQNVVDVTFNKLSGSVNKWSKEAAASYGLSETMAKKYVGTFGSMAEAFGFTEQQSYDMATALTGLTGDVASFYNLNQDLAYTKLKSVFSGETETLKDLGIVMTQTALDSYALANGYNKTTSEMTEAEKVTLRYKFVQDQLKNATGDFARTQDSWANQTRILQLRFDSLKATIGQGLINAFNPVLKVINSLIGRVSVLADKFKAFTDQIFGNAGDGSAVSADLADASNSAGDLATNADTTSTALNNVADKAEKAKRSIAGFDKLNVLSSNDTSASAVETPNTAASTSSTVKSLGSALSNAVDGLAAKWDAKGKKVIDSMKNAFSGVKSAVISIGDSWKRVWSNGTGEKVIGNIKKMLSNIFDIIGDISTAFQKAWNDNGKGDAVIQSIIDKFNSIIELINTIGDDFRDVWNSGVGERIWGNILTIIENCNNATKTFRDKIKLAWEKNDTGKKIWQDILGLVEDISAFLADMSAIRLEWLESLDLSPLVGAAERLLSAFRNLAKAITDKLKDAYKTVLLPLAKWTIEKAVPKLVEALAGALQLLGKIIKAIDVKYLAAIAAGIGAIFAAVKAYKAFKTISTIVENGIKSIRTAIDGFGKALDTNPYVLIFKLISTAIMGLVTAVSTYNALEWSNSEAGKFATEIDKIKGQIEETTQGITDNFENTLENLDSIYADNTLIDEYQEKLDKLLSKAELSDEEQAQLQTIVTYFSNNVSGFSDTWNQYVKISDDGKVSLKGDLEEVQSAIDKTIDDYQRLANSSALSELSIENSKSRVSAQKDLNEYKSQIDSLQDLVDFKESTLKNWLKQNDLSWKDLKSWVDNSGKLTSEGKGARGVQGAVGMSYSQAIDLYQEFINKNKGLDELKKTYNDSVAEINKLIMTSDDLSDVQKVLNGDYSDAAAVMMAYNAGMISLKDVQDSQWKSLSNLENAAKDTGKNTVMGLVEGTEEYKDALVINSRGLATTLLTTFKDEMGIHSPSREMWKLGVYSVQGLVNALSDMMGVVTNAITQMINLIKSALSPITNVFYNIFGGIWDVIRGPINTVMSGIESFINGIINGVKNMPVIDKILSKFGWSIGDIGELRLPRFAKGAIVKAPTLAVVGDNAGANTGNPEVIAPLNKLKTMIGDTTQQSDNKELLDYLKRIYEMLVINRNNGGNNYEFIAKLEGSVLFDEIVKQNEMYKKSHGGKSAFA